MTVFMIPIHIKITSVTIALLILLLFFDKENIKVFKSLFKDFKFIILILPFIFFLIAIFYSNDMKEGYKQLEVSASLILLPIIFKSFQNNKSEYKAEFILSFLIIGVVVAYIICMGVAIPKFLKHGKTYIFFYKSFSYVIKGPHHLSYYVIFAIIILISNLLNLSPLLLKGKKLIGLKIILLIICTIFLFQLASKATILLFLICMLIFFVYIIVKKIIPLKITIPIIAIMIMVFTYLISLPMVKTRFDNLFTAFEHKSEPDHLSFESTNLRFAAIDASIGIIKENPVFGVGTGDLFWAMSDYYKENYYQGAYIEHISPHNQFLRSYIMSGVAGFLSLITIFIMMFYLAYKNKHFLFLQWSVIMLVLFNVEDMLGIQDGIIYFCFFTSYFILCPRESKNNPSMNTIKSE